MKTRRAAWPLAAFVAATLFAGAGDDGRFALTVGQSASAHKVGDFFRRTGDRIRRGFTDAGRWVQRAAADTGRWFKKAAADTGRAIKKASVDTGKAFQKAGKSIGKFFNDAGKTFKKGWNDFKKGAQQFGTKLKEGFEKVGGVLKDAICATIGAPICAIVNIVKTIGGFVGRVAKLGFEGALKSYWEEFKQRIKEEAKYAQGQFEKLFGGFKSILTIRESNEIGPKIKGFAETVFNSVGNLTKRFLNLVGVPSFISQLLAWINGGTIAGTLTGALTPLALINFGVRKLMEWALPKLILGAGEAVDVIQRKYPAVGMIITAVMNVIKTIAPAAGGILGAFVKNPAAKEKIRAVLQKIASVSEKVQQGIKATLAVAEKARSGSFSDLEQAVAASATLPTKLSAEEVGKVIDGLVDFAKEQLWARLDPALRQLLGKALTLLDRLIDIPRNALVGAVGTIPFAGGVLASALNFGIGVVVDLLKNLLVDQILALAEEILSDVIDSMKGALRKQLLKNPGNVNRANKFIEAVKFMGDFAGDIAAVSKSIEGGSRDARGAITAVAMQAVDGLLLRGIANPRLREIISAALRTAGDQIGRPGVSLASIVGQVVRNAAGPVSQLVTGGISDAGLRGIVQPALSTLLQRLASPGAVRQAMGNPLGFLGDVAKQLISSIRGPLTSLVAQRLGNDSSLAGQLVAQLARQVNEEGFAVLLRGTTWTGLLSRAAASIAPGLIPGGAAPSAPPEEPAAEQPAAEQPASEQPAAEQPAGEQPAAEQPSEEQSGGEQPSEEQPAAEPAGGR